jgi:hypothetical protein
MLGEMGTLPQQDIALDVGFTGERETRERTWVLSLGRNVTVER